MDYVHTFLCTTLKLGDIVIADNLSSYKVADVAQRLKPGVRTCWTATDKPRLSSRGIGFKTAFRRPSRA
jgi:hypothetical protein